MKVRLIDDRIREGRFWELERQGTHVMRRWGKLGTAQPQRASAFLDTIDQARGSAEELIAEQLAKGFRLEHREDDVPRTAVDVFQTARFFEDAAQQPGNAFAWALSTPWAIDVPAALANAVFSHHANRDVWLELVSHEGERWFVRIDHEELATMDMYPDAVFDVVNAGERVLEAYDGTEALEAVYADRASWATPAVRVARAAAFDALWSLALWLYARLTGAERHAQGAPPSLPAVLEDRLDEMPGFVMMTVWRSLLVGDKDAFAVAVEHARASHYRIVRDAATLAVAVEHGEKLPCGHDLAALRRLIEHAKPD